MQRLLIATLFALAAGSGSAADQDAAPGHALTWTLDPAASRLGFLSLKNVDVAEAHHFATLSGGIADDGTVRFVIPLDSVETAVPIRNERMREHLFESGRFPEAMVEGTLDLAPYEALAVGASVSGEVRFTLDLHGTTTPLLGAVEVTRLAEQVLQVTTVRPILLNAATLGLEGGVEKLRELAGLKSISLSVPTWFSLTLRHRAG